MKKNGLNSLSFLLRLIKFYLYSGFKDRDSIQDHHIPESLIVQYFIQVLFECLLCTWGPFLPWIRLLAPGLFSVIPFHVLLCTYQMSYKVFFKNTYSLSHCWAFTHAIVFIQILEGIYPPPLNFTC